MFDERNDPEENAYKLGFIKGLEHASAIVKEREDICQDACVKALAGTLYPNLPNAFVTENCAMMEARHIKELIQHKIINL